MNVFLSMNHKILATIRLIAAKMMPGQTDRAGPDFWPSGEAGF